MGKYALCIGINDYPGTGSDLAGCVNDANDWATAFKARGFAVDKLLDGQAKGDAMRKAIRGVLARAKGGDIVILQYSGHGSFVPDVDGDEPDGTDECLCPHDISANGPITDDELFELYSSRPQGVKLLMISDSCHSGTVARFAPITTPPTMKAKAAPQRKVRFLPPSVFLPKREVPSSGCGGPCAAPALRDATLPSSCPVVRTPNTAMMRTFSAEQTAHLHSLRDNA